MALLTRPPRTDGHRTRDALVQQFADAGLVPVISTNGSNHEADIQQAKGPQAGEVLDAWLTARGEARLRPTMRGLLQEYLSTELTMKRPVW